MCVLLFTVSELLSPSTVSRYYGDSRRRNLEQKERREAPKEHVDTGVDIIISDEECRTQAEATTVQESNKKQTDRKKKIKNLISYLDQPYSIITVDFIVHKPTSQLIPFTLFPSIHRNPVLCHL